MKTDRKPPLARSPMRLRNRRVVQQSSLITPLRTPSVKSINTQMKESAIKPVNQTISNELRALSKMVQDELGALNTKNYSSNVTTKSAFERGRFYDEYTARRNERLRKKQSANNIDEPKTASKLGVKVETAKKKEYKKKTDSMRKTVAANYSVERNQNSRYSLRSSVKKPPLPVPMYVEEERMTARKKCGYKITEEVMDCKGIIDSSVFC